MPTSKPNSPAKTILKTTTTAKVPVAPAAKVAAPAAKVAAPAAKVAAPAAKVAAPAAKVAAPAAVAVVAPAAVTPSPVVKPAPIKAKAAKTAEVRAKLARRASVMLKFVSDPTRLQVILFLAESEHHVGALCEQLGQTQPAVSHHLALLRHGGIISPRRLGKNNFYSLSDSGAELAKVVKLLLQTA